jgi:hypothetical protein
MARYARIVAGAVAELRNFAAAPDPNPAKNLDWRSCPVVAPPSYNGKTEVLEGPTYTVGASEVTEAWSVRAKTAQEISDDKDAAVNGLNNSHYQALLKVLLELENDNRTIKTKINTLITDTGASTAAFTAGQASQITLTQLKNAIKNLLS